MNEIFGEERFYHISNVNIKNHFYPKIPKERLFNEDETIGRICVSDSLFGAFSAYPYLQNLIDKLCQSERYGTFALLYIFSSMKKSVPHENIISPAVLFEKYQVSDADITGEHWIVDTEMSFENSSSLIIREIEYEKFLVNFLTISRVNSIEFELSTENFEREFEYSFFDYDDHFDVRNFKELLNKNWIIDERIDEKDSFVTLRFKIPAGIDMTEIWSCYHSIREDYSHITRLWLPKPKCLTENSVRKVENPIPLFEECETC